MARQYNFAALAFSLISLLTTEFASAGTFSFATNQAAYTATPSGQVVVNVFLQETIQPGGVFVLASENGIFGYDVRAARTSGVATIVAMDANDEQFGLPEPAKYLPDPIPVGGSTTGEFVASAFDNPGPMGTLNGNTRSLLLGTFTVQTGANVGDMSAFTISDSAFFGSSTVTNAGNEIDTLTASANFTVTTIAVPEPTGFALVSIGCIVAAGVRRAGRRR